jgi:low temperature requirement protein LtrA
MEPRQTDGDSIDQEERVTTIELFFDLVFVFTLTQLTALLEHDQTIEAAGQVLLVFVVLFCMYGGYAWLTNQVPPVSSARQVVLIGGMAAFLICALSIPDAFGESAVIFGIGYFLVVLLHAGLFSITFGRAAIPFLIQFVPFNFAGALSVIAAAFFDYPLAYVLWLIPILLQYTTSTLVRRRSLRTGGTDIQAGHFVERHGLLLIVAFGESVIAIGIGAGSVELTPGTLIGAVLGLLLVSALWWAYFGTDADRAELIFREADPAARTRMALTAYFYAYIPMLLGIITIAAGVRLVLGNVMARAARGPAMLLGVGVALYLAGDAAFRLSLGMRAIITRAVGALSEWRRFHSAFPLAPSTAHGACISHNRRSGIRVRTRHRSSEGSQPLSRPAFPLPHCPEMGRCARTDRRDRSAHRAGAARRWDPAVRQPRRRPRQIGAAQR